MDAAKRKKKKVNKTQNLTFVYRIQQQTPIRKFTLNRFPVHFPVQGNILKLSPVVIKCTLQYQ